jgi:hypothetical protein
LNLKNKWNLCRVPLNQLAEKGWDATFWKVWEQLYLALSAQVYGLHEILVFMKLRQVFAGISLSTGEYTQTNILVSTIFRDIDGHNSIKAGYFGRPCIIRS